MGWRSTSSMGSRDETVPSSHAALYARAIAQARLRLLAGESGAPIALRRMAGQRDRMLGVRSAPLVDPLRPGRELRRRAKRPGICHSAGRQQLVAPYPYAPVPHGIMAGMRPFRFMVGSRDAVDARTMAERARWAEGVGFSHVCVHDHSRAAARADPLAHGRRDGDRAPPALPARLQQRPSPSGRAGPGAGEPGHHQRRAGGRRHRGGLERARIPRDRHGVRSAGDQDRPDDRGHRDPARPVRRRPVQLLGPVLHDHRRWTASRSRSSGRIRRSSSAARGSASSGWRLARPTSSGSTCASEGEAILDAFEARTDVRVGWIRDEAGDRLEQLDLNVLRLLGDITVTERAAQGRGRGRSPAQRPDGRGDQRRRTSSSRRSR